MKKPVEVKSKKPQKIGDATSVNTVKWQGNTYKIETSIKADTTLPLASDGTSEFYDNRVNVRILRSDGSEFFAGSFTKSNFKSYVDESYYKNGALLGIVFDKVVGNQLRFAASVGSPDTFRLCSLLIIWVQCQFLSTLQPATTILISNSIYFSA